VHDFAADHSFRYFQGFERKIPRLLKYIGIKNHAISFFNKDATEDFLRVAFKIDNFSLLSVECFPSFVI